MNNKQTEKRYTTLDAYQAGFSALRGFTPRLVASTIKTFKLHIHLFGRTKEVLYGNK
jgi:hypothetical protein